MQYRSVPSGYPNPTRYPTFFSIPDPTRFSFENYWVWVTRNIGYYPIVRVNPKKYPKYPEENQNTRKYPRINNVPGNTRSNISTLLPNPTRPATRLFCQYPTRPDIEKPYPLGTGTDETPVYDFFTCTLYKATQLIRCFID